MKRDGTWVILVALGVITFLVLAMMVNMFFDGVEDRVMDLMDPYQIHQTESSPPNNQGSLSLAKAFSQGGIFCVQR